MDLAVMLENTARRYRYKTALVCGDQKLSFVELDEASNKMANSLLAAGIKRGDRVAMLLPNCLEFVTIYFGIVKTGAIAVPLDVAYKPYELASLFRNCHPNVLVASGPSLETLAPVLPEFNSLEHVIEVGSGSKTRFPSYENIIAAGSARKVAVKLKPEDIAHIAYTSGPISDPRGAMMTHENMVTESLASAGGFRETDKDVVMLFALPLTHMFGLVAVLLGALYTGSTLVMVPGTGRSIHTLLATIEKEKGSLLLGVPYIFALAVSIAENEGIRNDLSSLRLCVSGGAPLSIDVINRFKSFYGHTIVDVWGLTEAVCHATCPPLNAVKPGSVGKALPGWQIKIVDNGGNEMPQAEPGEVLLKGSIMKGYHNNPRATAEAIEDGWLHTGDLGWLDNEGYLFLTGRRKEMIIVKGQNIYPRDIEKVLYLHPDVVEVAVIGAPDRLRGEIVCAFVSLKEGAQVSRPEIRRFCAERMINYRVPKQFVFIPALPRTPEGMVDKEALKDDLLSLSFLTG